MFLFAVAYLVLGCIMFKTPFWGISYISVLLTLLASFFVGPVIPLVILAGLTSLGVLFGIIGWVLDNVSD